MQNKILKTLENYTKAKIDFEKKGLKPSLENNKAKQGK